MASPGVLAKPVCIMGGIMNDAPPLLEPKEKATLTQSEMFAGIYPNIWIRPPKQGQDFLPVPISPSQFHRKFILNPRVRQCHLGTDSKGTRLLWLPDILAELNRLAIEQGTPGSLGEAS